MTTRESAVIERTGEPLTVAHLTRLGEIARVDREQLYAARPDLPARHVLTVLAQGGAKHWVDGVNGVKDLDVWSFFAKDPASAKGVPARRQTHRDFGPSSLGRGLGGDGTNPTRWSHLTGRRVDLLVRQLDAAAMTDPIGALLRWLESARTTSARFLRMKPVVFIDSPVALTVAMGDVLWRGE
jgi:hypothetical protein